MSIIQAIILGIVQGLTEFLPISSSAHLVIVPFLLNWQFPSDQILPFNVLVQLGTLLAVIVFFWKDLWSIVKGFVLGIVHGKPFSNPQALMGWYLIIATIPAGIFGLFFKSLVVQVFQSAWTTGLLLFVTAGLLLLGEYLGKRSRKITSITWLDALIIGFFQVLSIFPGVSRSGSTLSGGMLRHFDRPSAARFAFLMTVPVMLAAGLLETKDALAMNGSAAFLMLVAAGFVAAAVVGFLSIRWFISFVSKHSLKYFAFYCIALGALTLIVSYVR